MRPTGGMGMRGWVRGVATAAAAVALAGCWPAPGQGPHRQGYNPFERTLTIDNVTTLQPEWDVTGLGSNLVTADGVVVSAGGNTMGGFDVATGTSRWTVQGVGSIPRGAPVISDGAVYQSQTVLSSSTSSYDLQTGQSQPQGFDGQVAGFDGTRALVEQAVTDSNFTSATYSFSVEDRDAPDTGWGGVTLITANPFTESVRTSLGTNQVYASGFGLMATTPGDATSGTAIRAFGPHQPATCGPADNPVYACPLWVTPIAETSEFPEATAPLIGPGEETVYVGTDTGAVYAIDATSGAVRWTASLGARIRTQPSLANGLLYVPVYSGDVQVLAADGCGAPTCAPAWTASTGGVTYSQPAIAGGVLFVGTDTGEIQAFDAAGCDAATCAPVWSHDLGGSVTGPIVSGGRLIVGTSGGRLMSFRPTPPPAASGP